MMAAARWRTYGARLAEVHFQPAWAPVRRVALRAVQLAQAGVAAARRTPGAETVGAEGFGARKEVQEIQLYFYFSLARNRGAFCFHSWKSTRLRGMRCEVLILGYCLRN